MNLIYKNEKKLFGIILVISILFWLIVVGVTLGVIFLYLLLGLLIYLFSQSAFISHIKGNGVKVSSEQFPELYQQYNDCCDTLSIDEKPEIYILSSDGIVNALATKFLRRNYVILFSSVVDSLKKYPDGLNFYIGHELGHIKRGHLNWTVLLFPGMLLPLLGAAYSRAREYTCDLHGLECCKQPKDAAYAMAVLAAGEGSWNKLNVKNYSAQSEDTGSFWMSFHEFTGDYPWLCKRMNHIISASQNRQPDFPRRSIGAALLALLVPRVGGGSNAGGLVSLMIVIAIIGVLAAIALPAYQDYTIKAKMINVELIGEKIKRNASTYIVNNNELPSHLNIINLPEDLSNDVVRFVEISEEGFVLTVTGAIQLEGKTVIYQPYMNKQNQLSWRCNTGTLEYKYLPNSCK